MIFRATAQWFIAMDQNLLRQRALDAIDAVEYTARVGRVAPASDDRNASRVVHLAPAHLGNADSRVGLPRRAASRCSIRASRESLRSVSRKSAPTRGGPSRSIRFCRPHFVCPACGGTEFEKEKNIVDIWFESGVTHLAVLGRDGLPWPSDARPRRRRSIPRLVSQLAHYGGRDQAAALPIAASSKTAG